MIVNLMSVFEAIVNAIQSIEETGRIDGEILVEYHLKEWLFDESSSSNSIIPIKDIRIVDNGKGFNDDNLESFLKSDSTYKSQIGGKGIGRFTWLKIFDKVIINSIYKEKNIKKSGKFEFILDKNPIRNTEEEICKNGEIIQTEITLCNLKEEYIKRIPRTLSEFSRKIIEHNINYLVTDNCPKIILRELIYINDEIKSNELIINDKFNKEFLINTEVFNLNLGPYDFELKILKIRVQYDEKIPHEVMFSADNRTVYVEKMEKYIMDLPVDPLYDLEKDKNFAVVALVSGKYLDEKVNNERTDFNINATKKSEDLMLDELSLEDIEIEVSRIIDSSISKYLVKFREQRKKEIEKLVNEKAPQYRIIVSKYPDKLKKIKLNLSEDKLLLELYKIKNEISNEVRKEISSIVESNTTENNIIDYQKKFSALFSAINDVTMSELAEYVLHRKLIIDLLEKSVGINDDGKFELEKHIHNIIFPMRKDSDSVDYEGQNLWLIDERLSYHGFLTSDIPIDKNNRPDLLIGLDNKLVYSESKSNPYSSFVIIEFKRPMRENYDENPHDQVMRYIRSIKSGKAKDKKGRIINTDENSRFYIYIICDLTDNVKEMVEGTGYKKMAEGGGYFTFNDNYKAYIEVLSFDRVIIDAKRRNQILFDKLGISTK